MTWFLFARRHAGHVVHGRSGRLGFLAIAAKTIADTANIPLHDEAPSAAEPDEER